MPEDAIHGRCRGPHCIFSHAVSPTDKHAAVLQILNRWINYDDRRLYYAVENFEGTGPMWDKTPMVYAQSHPDARLLESNLNEALSRVKNAEGGEGFVCGVLSNSDVQIPGQPRLESEVRFTDPSIEEAYRKGEISLSTCFIANADTEGRIIGKVRPNHVLVFRHDEKNMPRDLGSMFLHKVEAKNVTNEKVTVENAFPPNAAQPAAAQPAQPAQPAEAETDPKAQKVAGIKAGLESIWAMLQEIVGGEQPPANPVQANKADTLTLSNQEKEVKELTDKITTEIEAKNAKIEALTAENAAMSAKIAAAEVAVKDAKWTEFRNKHVPPGWLAKEGSEAEQRKEFESDPIAYANKILESKRASTPAAPSEGTSYANQASGSGDHIAVARELRQATGRK